MRASKPPVAVFQYVVSAVPPRPRLFPSSPNTIPGRGSHRPTCCAHFTYTLIPPGLPAHGPSGAGDFRKNSSLTYSRRRELTYDVELGRANIG
jgi:hypothetical protein